MEQQTPPQSTLHKTFGIMSLVLCILAFLFSFISWLGMYAIFPGILGLIMGVVAFILAKKANAPKGIIVAGITLSLLYFVLSLYQFSNAGELDKISVPEKAPVKNEAFIKSVDSSLNDIEASLKSLEKDSVK
jgi:membrane-associated HD superfamily phosphohydrolase